MNELFALIFKDVVVSDKSEFLFVQRLDVAPRCSWTKIWKLMDFTKSSRTV